MRKTLFSLLLTGTLLFSQGCAVKMTERQATAITAIVVLGAAIAIISNNTDSKKRHRHHGHGKHCGCHSCR